MPLSVSHNRNELSAAMLAAIEPVGETLNKTTSLVCPTKLTSSLISAISVNEASGGTICTCPDGSPITRNAPSGAAMIGRSDAKPHIVCDAACVALTERILGTGTRHTLASPAALPVNKTCSSWLKASKSLLCSYLRTPSGGPINNPSILLNI